jgi:nucleoside-triphosphatase THEP1
MGSQEITSQRVAGNPFSVAGFMLAEVRHEGRVFNYFDA